MSDTSNHYVGRMNNEEDPIDEIMRKLAWVAFAIMALVVCSLFCGCKSTAPIYIESVKHDTLTLYATQRDSIYLHDSIYHAVVEKGDTVYITNDRWHTAYRDRWRHDSIYIAQIDTIHKREVVEVERKLTWWQRTRMMFGDLLLMFTAILAVASAYKIFRR